MIRKQIALPKLKAGLLPWQTGRLFQIGTEILQDQAPAA
jgi:hypothetical protein